MPGLRRGPSDQSDEVIYVGRDRRTRPSPETTLFRNLWAAAALLLVWVAVHVATELDIASPVSIDSRALHELLTTAVAVAATAAGLLAILRWRLTGEAAPLWTGLGIGIYGVVTVGLGHLAPAVLLDTADTLPELIAPASHVAAMTVLAAAALGPAVDTRLHLGRLVLGATTLVALLIGVLAAVPSLANELSGVAGHYGFAMLWLMVAGVHVAAGTRRHSSHHHAVATMALGLAFAELTTSVFLGRGVVGTPAAAAMQFLAVAFMLRGGTRELELRYCEQRERLFDTEVSAETAEMRRRAENAAHEERAHDAKNALLAIEGAAQILERYRDRLDPERRQTLARALEDEIARLRLLITTERNASEPGPFDIGEFLAPIVTTEQATGMRIEVEVPDGLTATGRSADTAEVIRNLIDNARNYAPGSPITIRAEPDGDWAVLYVEDRGAGIDRSERESIFERGRRGRAADGTDGSGLGLFISRRLMNEQLGDMWVENRQGGGASFGLCLPLAEPATDPPADSTPTDERPMHTAEGPVGQPALREPERVKEASAS